MAPFLDKRLVMTHYEVVDPNGQVLKEICGGQAEACIYDPVFFYSDGKYVIDECGGCTPADSQYEYSAWTLDAARSQILLKGEDDTAWYDIGVVKASDDSLKLAYSMKLIHNQVYRAMGEEPHPETIADNYALLTYSPE